MNNNPFKDMFNRLPENRLDALEQRVSALEKTQVEHKSWVKSQLLKVNDRLKEIIRRIEKG